MTVIYFLQMMDNKKYALKTRFEQQQQLEQLRQDQKIKNQPQTKISRFGFYDFFFFFVVIIVSVLCKVFGIDFNN